MNLKYSPQYRGNRQTLNQKNITNYYRQTFSRQAERIGIKQEGKIKQKKKKSWLKRALPYALPAIGTSAAVGLPFSLLT